MIKNVHMRYKLSYSEAYEAFYMIADRRGIKARYAVSAVLGIMAAVLTVVYLNDRMHIGYSLLSLLCALMMLAVLYSPQVKAKKGARKVSQKNGMYDVQIDMQGYFILKNGRRIALNGDKDARAYESDTLFAVRPDRNDTFCLPKRVMDELEQNKVRDIITQHIKCFTILKGKKFWKHEIKKGERV